MFSLFPARSAWLHPSHSLSLPQPLKGCQIFSHIRDCNSYTGHLLYGKINGRDPTITAGKWKLRPHNVSYVRGRRRDRENGVSTYSRFPSDMQSGATGCDTNTSCKYNTSCQLNQRSVINNACTKTR